MEKHTEKYLRIEIKKRGGWCIKLPAIFEAGLPDRIVLMPGGRIYFVEMKTKGKKPSPIQTVVHAKMAALGFQVHVLDCKQKVEDFCDEI